MPGFRWTCLVLCCIVGRVAVAQGQPDGAIPATKPAKITAGPAVDYRTLAFYPDRWQQRKIDTQLHPWEGKQVVLLTTTADLDPQVMGTFLARLDDGWSYYARIIGQSPRRFKHLQNKPTIAAVPDGRLTCGFGCGYVGATGIEVAGFYTTDYPLVKRNPEAFPHYYFYEMGRNYFVFGDRHSAFTTGYAVFMRYCCMEALKCTDTDARTRQQIEQAEALYAKTELTWLQAMTNHGGLDEKKPRLRGVAGPSDQPVMYASAMLKLRADHGGDAWVQRFFQQLARCPQVKATNAKTALQQSLNWLVAASVAARKDLSPTFVDRWRFPLGPQSRKVLKATDWNHPDLSVTRILKQLPSDPTQ